jgi:hypothetical protein
VTPTPELNKALAAFQAELPHVAKGNTADTGSYKYDYADIEDVFGTVLPCLGRHGLAFTAVVTIRDDGQRVLDYALLHASGEERGGCYPLPGQATAQQMGSAITYARRYSLLAVTGVAPGGEDDDGKAASDAHPAPVESGRGETPLQQPVPFATATVGHFKRLGIPDRDVQLGYIAALTGHAVTTPRDLTADEKTTLLEVLSKCRNREALDQQAKARQEEAAE